MEEIEKVPRRWRKQNRSKSFNEKKMQRDLLKDDDDDDDDDDDEHSLRSNRVEDDARYDRPRAVQVMHQILRDNKHQSSTFS